MGNSCSSGKGPADSGLADEKTSLTSKKAAHEVAHAGMERSSCTDPLCLIVFIAFMVGMVYVFIYGYQNGDPRKLTNGVDWLGQVCGLGNVTDKPKLYWCGAADAVAGAGLDTFNFQNGICVEDCPSATSKVYCPTTGSSSVVTSGDLNAAFSTVTTLTQETKGKNAIATKSMADLYCWPDTGGDQAMADKLLANFNKENQVTGQAMAILRAVMELQKVPVLLGSIFAGAVVISFVYLILLRFIAKPLVYLTLATLILSTFAAGAFFLVTPFDLTGNKERNPLYANFDDDTAKQYSLILGGVGCALGLVFVILACCAHSAIATAAGCIEAACECMFDMPSLLIEPIVGAILKIGILLVLLAGFMYVLSTGQIGQSSVSVAGVAVHGVSREMTWTEEQKNFIYYYVFGIFWIMEMCDAMQCFVVSYAVVLWYYEPNTKGPKRPFLPVVRGFGVGLAFHLGSIAFGAFLIALTRPIQILFAYLAKQQKDSGNQAGACIASCCLCCVTCFQKFIQFINKNAYIDIAVKSNDFLPAALHAFEFMFKNAADVGILAGAGTFAQVLGVLSITSGGAFATKMAVENIPRWSDATSDYYISDWTVVTAVGGMVAFCVSIVFMLVFDQCADTLLYVYADNQMNDPDSIEQYAPSSLRNLVISSSQENAGKTDNKDEYAK